MNRTSEYRIETRIRNSPMTVCVAAMCCDGQAVVVASDTMVTNPGIPIEFEHRGSKISELSKTCVAMTAGDALAYTELFGSVRCQLERVTQSSVFEIVARIKECYKQVRHQEIQDRVLGPRGIEDIEHFYHMQNHLNPDVAFGIQSQIDKYDYGLDILVAGATSTAAHIYGIQDPGTSQCYDAIHFHAIGSGTPHALNALIARDCHQGFTIENAILAVYEAKRLAEKAPGVGSVTDMCIVSGAGINTIPREQINEIEPIFQKWIRHDSAWESDIRVLLRFNGEGDNDKSPT
jgi:hypothetical protein